MAVNSTYTPAQYDCDGIVKAFTFSFGIAETSDLQVILTNSSGGETVLTETTHYSVSATNNDYSSGGTVTTVSTYASGYTLTIRRVVAIKQEADFVEGMPTLYGTFESCLDLLTWICQQLDEQIGRCPALGVSSEYSDLTLPEPVSGAYLRTKTDLSGYENVMNISATGATQTTDGWYSSTMTTDESVTATGTYLVCILDPNGANRNFDLVVSGAFRAEIINIGPNMITFDSAGLGLAIGAGDVAIVFYDTTAPCWRGKTL